MIDERADVDPGAELGADVEIGPWSVIGPGVVVGDGCRIGPHAIVRGPTVLGRRNRIFQFATVGEDTPALSAYGGEPTTLTLGDDNVIREGVTIHRGMLQDRGATLIGNNNLFMAYVHVGHDCEVGDHVIMANNASLAGHVSVGDHANIGGYSGILQFRSVGAHAHGGGVLIRHQGRSCLRDGGGESRAGRGIEHRGHAPAGHAGIYPQRAASSVSDRVPRWIDGGGSLYGAGRGGCRVGAGPPVRGDGACRRTRHRASATRCGGGLIARGVVRGRREGQTRVN